MSRLVCRHCGAIDWDRAPRALQIKQLLEKRGAPPKRTSWLPRGTTPIPKINVAATKRRTERYAKALRSPHWKALRRQVLEEQGGLCICQQEPMTVLDHKTYARLGHELREDVQGLGAVCNARETTSKRANWVQGGRRR